MESLKVFHRLLQWTEESKKNTWRIQYNHEIKGMEIQLQIKDELGVLYAYRQFISDVEIRQAKMDIVDFTVANMIAQIKGEVKYGC